MLELLNHQSEKSTEKWWSKIHLVALIGLLFRVILVFISDLSYHPDEIFQYLEQAHRLEFGYGIIPWEYRYGIRSWILPGFLSGLLHIFHVLNIDQPYIYIPTIRIFFCIISLSAIYSSYIIVRNIASEKAGKLASLFACFWYELVYFASKCTPEVLSTYCLLLALAFIVSKSQTKNVVFFALFCALATILRYQYLSVVFILIILGIFKWKKKGLLTIGIIFILTIAAAGYIDYLTWGSFFASYYNNYLYNSVYKISEIFGTQPNTYYLKSLIYNSGGLFLVFGILSFIPTEIKKTWLFFLCLIAIIVSHSLIAHKEYRFIFAAIPFFLMIMAILISDFILQLRQWKYKWGKTILYSITTFIFCLSISGLFFKLPFQSQIYYPLIDRRPILQAYLFMHKESNLVSVFDNYSDIWFATGGYYYLHRYVPIYYQSNLNKIMTDNLEKINVEDYHLHFSHIICKKNQKTIPNFATIFKFEDLEVRKNINPPEQYIILDLDTINKFQFGVDDRYKPLVEIN